MEIVEIMLKKLPEKAQDQIRTDTPLEPRPGKFYLLPKIHKPGNPGRPIISGIGTLTAGLSGYVDSLLRPYATSTPSYLRDTTDFLRKLQSIGDLPDNTILATMDVEALYTNIPHKNGLQTVRNTIPDNVTANLVAELCDFVLTHNYFTFGDNVYLQISGTAMGTCMAPQYAHIFMADLEKCFLSSRPLTPLLYLRYIDDIFIIWTHGKEALEEFHHDFNNFQKELQPHLLLKNITPVKQILQKSGHSPRTKQALADVCTISDLEDRWAQYILIYKPSSAAKRVAAIWLLWEACKDSYRCLSSCKEEKAQTEKGADNWKVLATNTQSQLKIVKEALPECKKRERFLADQAKASEKIERANHVLQDSQILRSEGTIMII
nr:uncharacterized protein LOC125636878 [Caretta caretta]